MTEPAKTVKDVLDTGARYLHQQHACEPESTCGLLLARLLRCKPLELPLRYADPLSDAHLEAMRRGVRRLAAGEPVQYILGEWDFRGRPFKTDKRALIPRPETEELVGHVLDALRRRGAPDESRPVVADVGTGSGCIVISLALEYPAALYLGTDTSGDALALAGENAARHALDGTVAFLHGELCDLVDPESLDLIVANLPYITTADYERLPRHIREHEPRGALDGGPDGLRVVETVCEDATVALKSGGGLFLEIGAGQSRAVTAMLAAAGYADIRVLRDIAGHDRIIHATWPAP